MRQRCEILFVVAMAMGWFLLISSPAAGTSIGITADGRFFTVDVGAGAVPTFLNGVSYYGAQTVTTPSYVEDDLDDMVADGFNWIRVWVYWTDPVTSEDVSVLTDGGAVRTTYMNRLKTLIQECDERGMIVDCSFSRDGNDTWVGPTNQTQHLAAVQTLATELYSCTNVYFDLANECDVMDARYVSPSELTALKNRAKQYKPGVLCTASVSPQDEEDMYDWIIATGLDFCSPHLCRSSGCPALTYATVKNLIGYMAEYSTRKPIHLQEPFRRGYGAWQPGTADFLRDCVGGKNADAAGWCLHNGDNYDNTPFRSFRMTNSNGRLYSQWETDEQNACNQIDGHIAGTNPFARRYQAEWDEQLYKQIGRADGDGRSANVAQDAAGYLTYGPYTTAFPANDYQATWRMLVDNNTANNDNVVTIDVFDPDGGGVRATRTITRQEWTAANTYQDFTLTFTHVNANHRLEFRTNWLDKSYMRLDYIDVRRQSTPVAPIINEVTPDPGTALVLNEYTKQLTLAQGYPAPTWSKIAGPAGATVNSNGFVSGWTPQAGDVGTTKTFTIRATNSQGYDDETWQVYVTNVLATYEGSTGLSHLCGSEISGNDWRCTTSSSNCFMAYGPYTTTLPGGSLTARFWLRVDNNTSDDADICEIDINDSTTGTLLNKTIVSRKDFSAASTYQSFDLPFTNTAGHSMEFRVFYIGQARLDLDKVQALNGAYAPTPKGRIVQRANTYDGALFYLYVPSTATTSNPLPLVITCHSTVTNAAAEIGLTCDATWGCCEGGSSNTKWHQLAENIGNVNGHNQPFIVAAPVCASANGGLETPWTGEAQAATDRQRILAIYNQIVGTESSTYGFAVDTDSTLLTGWSGGGIPTYYVGVREADVFSMIISRQGNFNEDMFDTASWPLDTSLGVGILAGSSDTVVPMSTHEAASAFFESEGYTALFPANPANRKHVRVLPDSEFPSVPSNHYCHSLVAFDTFMDYLAGPVNQAPVADAGNDQTVVWPDDDAALDGTVTDDGLPSPPGAVTVTWTKQSGPGTVSFANPNAVDTTATFSTQGTYVLRLTASDSVLSDYDEVTITVSDCTPALEATFQGSSGFSHLCGSAISGDDWRVTVANNNCFMAYGPYTSSLPAGDMVARWYLRVDNNTADNADICQIDVYDATGSQFLAGPMTISRMDWTQAGVYQAFDLPFTNPGGGHQLEFRTYYISYSQLDLDKVEAWSTCGGGGEPEIISLSSFASSADGWTAEGWKAGQYSNGTMAFNSSVGNPAGSMKSTGSGSTNTTDSCTREGGLIKKVISTTGHESITLDYDLRFNTNQSGGSCSGGCMSTVVEGDCADKVAVYYSTSGTGGPWTLLEQVYASQLTQGTFYSRHIDLPAGAANQAGFALMFKFQFNTSSDVGYVDNVEIGGVQQ